VSGALFESVTRIARHEAGARALPAVGKVVETFGASGSVPDHAVTVELRDSGLVLPQVPVAVGMLGAAALPAVDDLVVVAFLEGDRNAPVVIGRLYSYSLAPPTDATDGKLAVGLPPGSDPPDLKLVVETDGSAATLEVGDEPVKVLADHDQLQISVGALELTITKSGGGRAELKLGGSELTLKKDGDVTLKTSGKLTLEGSEVEVKGSSKVKVSGGTVELN
jgi:uncharacterized protein involved in type VI secretion and phage assembly